MKGVVFTEFLEMVEDRFGLECVDRILEKSDLESDGAYTAVGTYDHHELLQLVGALSEELSLPAPELVRAFAHHLFQSFAAAYPFILEGIGSSVELLQSVEGFIHVEVKKLYPDAELPSIKFQPLDDEQWELTYRSARPFADLCEGLIDACIQHFGNDLEFDRRDIDAADGCDSRFLLRVRQEAPACTTKKP